MFIIEVPFFDLDKTYKSNQSYMWRKVNDKKYFIRNGNYITLIQQQRDRFCFACSEEEFYNVWFDYLDLGFDYLTANYDQRRKLKSDAVICKGLHVLNQNKEELVFRYCSKDKNEFNRILSLGKKRKNTKQGITLEWREMPELEKVLKNNEMFSKEFICALELYVNGHINFYSLQNMKEQLCKLGISENDVKMMYLSNLKNNKKEKMITWLYNKYLMEYVKWD